MHKSVYRSKPIGSLAALSLALNTKTSALQSIATRTSTLYASFSTPKKDGTQRPIVSPHKELKFLQKRINRQVFENIDFPPYLFGGIKDRDYVKNAIVHQNAKALIALDVKNFYPSISEGHVQSIFQNFCNFPKDVAHLLTKICTLEGKVPQGACTSSYIANLVFYDVEPLLVDYLNSKNLRYTRLLDDISISSHHRNFSKKEIEEIIERVTAMLSNKGMHLKNKKTRITTKSNPVDLMEVTGLWLNRGKPRVKREERINIRHELRLLSDLFKISRTSEDYHKKFNHTSGRVAKLSHLGYADAQIYRSKLREKLPFLGIDEIIHLRRQVHGLSKSLPKQRDRFEYIDKFNRIRYKVMILRRNNVAEFNRLNTILDGCRPSKTKEQIIYE